VKYRLGAKSCEPSRDLVHTAALGIRRWNLGLGLERMFMLAQGARVSCSGCSVYSGELTEPRGAGGD
jgi:hypothetical protein